MTGIPIEAVDWDHAECNAVQDPDGNWVYVLSLWELPDRGPTHILIRPQGALTLNALLANALHRTISSGGE